MPPMDWTYPAGTGDAGIFEIARRLAAALGHAPDATRFTYDPRAMLRTTREIEAAARGGHLLVGFQMADKLVVEAARYADLLAAGTNLTVWARESRPADARLATLDYREVGPDILRLEAQWFLVSEAPEPLAFVSYELGDPATFGVGGASTSGKRFVGFVSDDPAVVALLVATLAPIGAPPKPPAAREPSEAALNLVRASRQSAVDAPPGTPAGALIVATGRGEDRSAFLAALGLAAKEARALVLVDRTAEGFASPYGDLRGEDADRPSPDRLFDATTARREGRGTLATYLDAAAAAGIEAGAWFPTRAGADGLADATRRFGGALVLLPAGAGTPGLAERLRGMTPERIRVVAGVPVLVAPAD